MRWFGDRSWGIKQGLLSGAVGLGYVAGTAALAAATGERWSAVVLCEADRQDPFLVHWVVVPVTWLCGCLLMAVIPGLPWAATWKRARADMLSLLAAAVAISIAAQIAVGTAFKLFVPTTPLNRVNYVLLLMAVFLVGWLRLMLHKGRMPKLPAVEMRLFRRLAVGFGFVILVTVCFWPKLVREDFSGDGIEAFELARSLRQHLVPTWDLELRPEGFFGWSMVHPPLLAYLHLPSLLLFGENEVGVRALYLFCYLCLVPVVWGLIEDRDRPAPAPVQLVALVGLLPFVLNSLFYAGMHPDFCDFAKCGEIVLVTFAMTSLLLLERRHLILGVAFAVLASGIRWYGPFLMLIPLVGYAASTSGYWKALLGFLIALACLGLIVLGIGAACDLLPAWKMQYEMEHSPLMQAESALFRDGWAIGWHVLIFSGFLVPSLLLIHRQDRLGRILSFTVVGFLLFGSRSATFLNHFLLPIAVLPAIVVCRMLREMSSLWSRRMAVAFCLALQSLAVWWLLPTHMAIHTASRELGRETCFLVESYEDAVALAPVIYGAGEEFPGRIGHHTWVHYSARNRTPSRRYAYYVTDRGSPALAGCEAIAVSPQGAVLFARPEGRRRFRQMSVPKKDAFYRHPWLRAIISSPW